MMKQRGTFRSTIRSCAFLLTAMAAGTAQAAPLAPAAAPTPQLSAEQRLARLERMLDNQGLVDLLVRLESLQAEVQRLRGEVEVQTHTIAELKKRQRELYLDIDRRLLGVDRLLNDADPHLPPLVALYLSSLCGQ